MLIRHTRLDELTARELHALLHLRQSVFVVEQVCPYPDIDARDLDAIHLIAFEEAGSTAPIGCARCLGPDAEGTVSFGRLAILPDWRGSGLGRRLVTEALEVLAEQWPGREVVIGAQAHLEAFYASFGFRRLGDVYDDVGVPHLDMQLTR